MAGLWPVLLILPLIIEEIKADGGECSHVQPPVWYKGFRHLLCKYRKIKVDHVFGTTFFAVITYREVHHTSEVKQCHSVFPYKNSPVTHSTAMVECSQVPRSYSKLPAEDP